MKKELEMEEKLRLLEKEVSLLTDDFEKIKLDLKEIIDLQRIEIESLKIILRDIVQDFQEKFDRVRNDAMREIDPEWPAKRES